VAARTEPRSTEFEFLQYRSSAIGRQKNPHQTKGGTPRIREKRKKGNSSMLSSASALRKNPPPASASGGGGAVVKETMKRADQRSSIHILVLGDGA
jgi:hypothetical protein